MIKYCYLLFIAFLMCKNICLADNTEVPTTTNNSVTKTDNFFTEIKQQMEDSFEKWSNNRYIIATKDTLTYIFAGENPIFKDKKHNISFTYARGVEQGLNTNLFFGSYSVPVKLFVNSRATIEIGGITGTVPYLGKNSDISQCIGGVMYEMIFNANYVYFTAGIGIYIRNADSSSTPGDRVGSQFVFGEKFGIGKTFFDRYNLEIIFRHFSNGYLTTDNAGYNFVGLTLGILL